MKELSIEQKAKRYDEALKKMKAWVRGEYPECFTEAQKTAEFIFPELKESEDERIRKDIIEMLRNWASVHYITKEQFSERMAWLEKQGSYTEKDVDDAYLKGISDAKNEIEKQYEASYQIRKDIATFIFNYRGDLKDRGKWMHYLGIRVSFVKNQDDKNPQLSKPKSALEAAKEEKMDNQNCVKPDKNEPEFHEGEWVANDYCVGKVIALTDDAYLLDTGQGIPFSCEHNAHLWTIQDAKDGDVLVASDGSIFLFAGVVDYACKYYAVLTAYNEVKIKKEVYDSGYWETSRAVRPATKEQRDLLFSKMKEAGYEWDADKKELKIVDWSKHIKYNPNATSITEEKPAWTEEDTKKLYDILSILRGGENCYYNSPILIDWLKSLKEKIGG